MTVVSQGLASQSTDALSALLGTNRAATDHLRRLVRTSGCATLPELAAHLAGSERATTGERASSRSAAVAILGDPNIVKRQRLRAAAALQQKRREAQREANEILAGWGSPPGAVVAEQGEGSHGAARRQPS